MFDKINYGNFEIEIISDKYEKEFVNKYICKVNKINGNLKYKNTKLILYTNKFESYNYGDILNVTGNFSYAKENKNYKSFNYRRNLWQEKIYGILEAKKVEKFSTKLSIGKILNKLKIIFENNIEQTKLSKDQKNFLKSILYGDKSDLSEDIKQDFKGANLSHILAISGMHISYIIIMLNIILKKVNSINFRRIICLIILFLYINLIGQTPSSVRALIMYSMIVFSKLFYRKYNLRINLMISLIILLLINPFYIENIGMWLSIAGTYGIIEVYSKINFKLKNDIFEFFFKNFLLSICVQICIFPIIIYNYNTISFTFFISNIFISIFIAPIIFIGFFISFFGDIFGIVYVQSKILNIVFYFSKLISNFKLSKKIISTPNIEFVLFYYIILFFIIYKPQKINKFLKEKFSKIIICIIIIFCFNKIITKMNSNFELNFLDVGQGDCAVIKTKENKRILIDGGEGDKYDQGKNVVLPYLLDKKINEIDYMIISHFDSDHCGGLFYIIDNLKIKNIIIGKQFEISENYEKFINLVKEKEIKVYVVQAGKRINIESNLYIDILWPDENNVINDNSINNNSLVCKLTYNEFSILFTGDIEEKAEKVILQKYKNNLNILKSVVLKVAHHGSKTSSTNKFLEVVSPNIALIGVGENNTFGHPSSITLENLQNIGCKIYRTDENGEISIRVNGKGMNFKVISHSLSSQ